ncbi:MAG: hypothetical protein ACJ72N_22475 [Labedaea sp.]
MNIGRKVLIATFAVAAAVLVAPSAGAATDVTPPTVPQNVHDASQLRSGANAVLNWDASTDVGTGVKHYWVLVDGQQRAKPIATTYDIQTLVNLGRITPGPHSITVQAVDFALNRSAASAPINIVVS